MSHDKSKEKGKTNQKKPDGLPPSVPSLYFRMKAAEQIQLDAEDKKLLVAALEKKYPVLLQLSAVTEQQKPLWVAVMEWLQLWGRRALYALTGAVVVLLLYVLLMRVTP